MRRSFQRSPGWYGAPPPDDSRCSALHPGVNMIDKCLATTDNGHGDNFAIVLLVESQIVATSAITPFRREAREGTHWVGRTPPRIIRQIQFKYPGGCYMLFRADDSQRKSRAVPLGRIRSRRDGRKLQPERLEDRLLLAVTSTPWMADLAFDQFSGGGPKVLAIGYTNSGQEAPELLGYEFCRMTSCGGTPLIDTKDTFLSESAFGSYGATGKFEVGGKIGLEYGLYANAGTANLLYDGAFDYELFEGTAGPAVLNTNVNYLAGGVFTQSPTVCAFADLVMELNASLSGRACFISCAQGSLPFSVSQRLPLMSINRSGNGELEILGTGILDTPQSDAADRIEEARDLVNNAYKLFKAGRELHNARTNQQIQQAQANRMSAVRDADDGRSRQNAINQQSRSGRFGGGSVITVDAGPATNGLLGVELEVGAGFSGGGFSVNQKLGSFSVSLPDIALSDSFTGSENFSILRASTNPSDTRRELSKLSLDVGGILGGGLGLGTKSISAGGILDVELTTISYDLDTTLAVNQEIVAGPLRPTVHLDFVDAVTKQTANVDVRVNGVRHDDVASIDFAPGANVTLQTNGNQLVEVRPSMQQNFRFQNDVGLDIDLSGTLRAFKLMVAAADVEIFTLGPLLERTDNFLTADLGSLFNDQFDIQGPVISAPSFTIGGDRADVSIGFASIIGNPPRELTVGSVGNLQPELFSMVIGGGSTAKDVVLRATVPDGFQLHVPDSSSDCSQAAPGAEIVCTIGDLPAAGFENVDISLLTNQTLPGNRGTIQVTVTSSNRDVALANNERVVSVGVYESQRFVVGRQDDADSTTSPQVDCSHAATCTLREALRRANESLTPDVIEVSVEHVQLMQELVVTAPVDIIGSRDELAEIRALQSAFSVFIAVPGGTVDDRTLRLVGLRLVGGDAGFTGIFASDPSNRLVLDNVTISNFTQALEGGGIYASGMLDLRNTTITGNSTLYAGGAIHAGGSLNMDNVMVEGNSAEYGGGIFLRRGASASISHSRIANNTAADGGGVHVYEGILNLDHVTLTGNSAPFGGAISLGNNSTAHISRSDISGNRATTTGGAVSVFVTNSATAYLSLTDSLISGNQTETDGPAIYLFADPTGRIEFQSKGSVFVDNTGAPDISPETAIEGELQFTSEGYNLADHDLPYLDHPTDRRNERLISFAGRSDVASNMPGAEVGPLVLNRPATTAVQFESSDSRFIVDNGVLRLAEQSSVNALQEPSVTLQISVTDEEGLVWTQSVTVHVVPVPDPVGNFTAEVLSSSEVLLRWNLSPYASEYVVYRQAGTETIELARLAKDQQDYRVTRLPHSSQQSFYVEAINVSGTARSNTIMRDLPPPMPVAPQDLTVSPVGTTTLLLSWVDAQFEDRLKVFQVGDTPGDRTLVADLPADTVDYTLEGLDPDTAYRLEVVAANASGESASEVQEVVTLPLPPESPTDFMIDEATANSVRLQWTAVDGAIGYRVYTRSASNEPIELARLTAAETSYEFSGLTTGTFQEYFVQSLNRAGLGVTLVFGVTVDGQNSLESVALAGKSQTLDLSTTDLSALGGLSKIDVSGFGSNRLTLDLNQIQTLISQSGSLTIKYDMDDVIEFGDGWTVSKPRIETDGFRHILTQGQTELLLDNDTPWTNPLEPLDIDRNGIVAPLDALLTINLLGMITDLTRPESSDAILDHYLDVDRNQELSPLDSLFIINQLNFSAAASSVSVSTFESGHADPGPGRVTGWERAFVPALPGLGVAVSDRFARPVGASSSNRWKMLDDWFARFEREEE